MSVFARVYARMPRFAQVLVDDAQRLHEYPSFMRLAMTFGTITFLYKFSQTMAYMESEKHPETPEQRLTRRRKEKEIREILSQEALAASTVVAHAEEHIRNIIQRANSS